jgi:ubiquinol-cytochrome c reductase cytochrome c subunit
MGGRPPQGAHVRDRITVITGVLTAGCAVLLIAVMARPGASGASAAPSAASPTSPRAIYLRDCATCHGADARGTPLGPDLLGMGAAQIDFQLSTGRMPVPMGDASAHPERVSAATAQARRPPKYDPATRRELVQYVVGLTGGDPALPRIDPHAGDLAAGGNLYRLQCAACHAWSGDGGALLHREAPSTHLATPLQIAEAVRAGPGNMPRFGRAALSHRQLQSLVRYVRYLDHPDDRGGEPLWHVGPLAEGAVAVFIGLGLLVFAVRWIGTRS